LDKASALLLVRSNGLAEFDKDPAGLSAFVNASHGTLDVENAIQS
jgi:hypothetical protein